MKSDAEPKRLIATAPPLSCSGCLDLRTAEHPVIQCHIAARDHDGVGAIHRRIDDAGAGGLRDRCLTGDQGGHRRGAAVEIDQLHVQPVPRVNTGIARDERRRVVRSDADIADVEFGELRERVRFDK